MQTQTLDNLEPYNEVAKLIDDEIHAEMLERINFLAREYEIRNPSEVAKFLRENLFLFDLLKEIPQKIREFFGEEQNLNLKFNYDFEDPNYHRLFVGIPTNSAMKKSSELLNEFDENWWFENERKSSSKILIDLEFAE